MSAGAGRLERADHGLRHGSQPDDLGAARLGRPHRGTTDPVLDAAARFLSGLPIKGAFGAILRTGDRLTRERPCAPD